MTRRLPMTMFFLGIALKGLILVVWRNSHEGLLLALLTDWDPAAFWFAESTTTLAFDPMRIYPGPIEEGFFEVMLVLGTGAEAYLVGLLARAALDFFARRRRRKGVAQLL